MNQQKNLKDQYIQLVETFINAIESGRSGAELGSIRNDIRMLSATVHSEPTVENISRNGYCPADTAKIDERKTGVGL
jgi:hypothetical protein